MDLKRIAKDTTKTLVSYLTYKAVQTVAAQLRETNPPLYMWFHSFSSETTIQDGEVYLKKLMQVNQDLALRVMTVRAHIAEEVADYLPEMLQAGVQQANMKHRRLSFPMGLLILTMAIMPVIILSLQPSPLDCPILSILNPSICRGILGI